MANWGGAGSTSGPGEYDGVGARWGGGGGGGGASGSAAGAGWTGAGGGGTDGGAGATDGVSGGIEGCAPGAPMRATSTSSGGRSRWVASRRAWTRPPSMGSKLGSMSP